MTEDTLFKKRNIKTVLVSTLLAVPINSLEASPFAYGDTAEVTEFWEQNQVAAFITTDPEAFAAFSRSNFSWDDAVLLAEHWGSSETSLAKLKAGRRIVKGHRAEVQQLLETLRAKNRIQTSHQDNQQYFDAFFARGYDWDDAVAISAYFGIADPVEAKLKAGNQLVAGHYNWVDRVLELKRAEETQQNNQTNDQKAYDAFFRQGYGYNEAEKIAIAWGLEDVGEAKLKAGRYILDYGVADIANILANATAAQYDAANISDDTAWDAYANSGYDWDDASRLENAWGLSSTNNAKLKIGRLILTRQEHRLPGNVAP